MLVLLKAAELEFLKAHSSELRMEVMLKLKARESVQEKAEELEHLMEHPSEMALAILSTCTPQER